MGYNRSGVRRTARMKRRKRLEMRLAEKATPKETATPKESAGQEGHGKSLEKVAKEAVAKVGGILEAAVDKVKQILK